VTLDVLIGGWKRDGWTRDDPPARIDAVDTYEWRPGRHAAMHHVDARVGDERVEGAEIIGWDPARECYVTQYFGSDGPAAYEATLREEDGALVWTMRSRSDRFTGTFSDDRTTITGHWESMDEGSDWQPWMDITLTKGAS
jgi:hypothetical protein